ncbi:MAG TPA: metallophosphoesterase [Arthrobacter sp.]|nr:metallophosphoesterase [Arthrobacter sp.]
MARASGVSRRSGTAIALLAALLLALPAAGCTAESPPPPSGTVSSGAAPSDAAPSASAPSAPPSPGAAPAPRSSPAEPPVVFTAEGDIGVGSSARKVLDAIAKTKPQLNLALGDFTYQAGIEQQFCDMVTGKLGPEFPYELVAGNHESDGHDGDIANFVKCLPNRLPGLQGEYGTQWFVDVPQENPLVRIVMVSPGIKFRDGKPLDYGRDSDRWRWTADALDGAKARKIPWTVVGMHTPCFNLGAYACQPGADFTNLLIEKKVDLVLSGHQHLYQRTHQLGLGPGCPALVPDNFSSQCLGGTGGTLQQGRGTVFAGIGIGGVGLHDVREDDPEAGYFAAWSGKNRTPTYGTLKVSVGREALTAELVAAEGSFTDTFTITR